MFQKREKIKVQTCSKLEPLKFQKNGSNKLKTQAKERERLVLICPKSEPPKKEEESALTSPKPELK